MSLRSTLARATSRLAGAIGGSPSGELRVISVPGGGWGGGGRSAPQWLTPSTQRIAEAYRGYVAIAIEKIVDKFSTIPLELYEETGDEWERIPNHPALELLDNPGHGLTRSGLIRWTERQRIVYGNGLWFINAAGRGFEPKEIMAIPWPCVRVERKPHLGIIGYTCSMEGGKQQTLLPEDCIHFRGESLDDALVGVSELLRCPDAIDLAHFSAIANTAFFRFGALISTLIKTKDVWTKDKRDDFHRAWRAEHQGVDKSHVPLIVEGDEISVEQMKPGGADIDFHQGKTDADDEILANWAVPRAVIGQSTAFNRANMDAAIYAFQAGAIEGRVKYWYGCDEGGQHQPGILETQYFARWETRPSSVWRVSYADFIARDREQDRADVRTRLGEGTGIATASPNQIREFYGDDPVDTPDADELFVQAGKLKLSEDRTAAQATPFGMVYGGTSETKALDTKSYAIWKKFVAQHSRREKLLQAAYQKEAKRQEREVLARLERLHPKAFGLFAGWARQKARAAFLERKDIIDQVIPESETERILEAVLPLNVETVTEAAKDAYRRLGLRVPKTKDALVSVPGVDDPIDEAAVLGWLRATGMVRVTEINETTRKKLARAFADNVADGGTFADLVRAVREVYDEFDSGRALRIARTETTGAWNYGQIQAAESLSITVNKLWLSAVDERTRESHLAADGQSRKLNEPFEVDGEEMEHPGDPSGSAENVINCFLPGTKIAGSVHSGFRATYRGHAIEIRTASGLVLSVTPNHPVLTPSGFVAAQLLKHGDNLLRYRSAGIWRPDRVDVDHPPSAAEDLFMALAAPGVRRKAGVSSDFHGDGRGMHGDIEIVGAAWKLLADGDPRSAKPVGNIGFEKSNMGHPSVAGEGSRHLPLGRVDGALSRAPGGGALTDNGLAIQASPLQPLRIGSASEIDASRHKPATENASPDAGFCLQLLQRYPALVLPDEIVNIRDFEFSGHVFDFQSPYGWIVANGIFSSNCRCTMILEEAA